MSETIHTQSSYSAVLNALVTLPQEVTGDNTVSRHMLTKSANTLLGLIRKSFLIKSAGGTDEAGDRWAPLSIKTVEARAKKRGAKVTKRTIKKRRPKRELSDNPSRRRIQGIIRSREEPTHDKYAKRDVAILNDSGALLGSLSPNSNSPDQILQISSGSFSIGTKRVGALAHHRGVPSKNIPQRRLWPDPKNWPDSWWNKITKNLQDGVVETIKEVIRGAM